MSKFTDELLTKHALKPDDVHLAAGGVAVFGRTGTGKSTMFFHSRFIHRVYVIDTGSMAHKLWAGDRAEVIMAGDKESPAEQVTKGVEYCHRAGKLYLVDSWSTLQEQQVAWYKRTNNVRGAMKFPQHNDVIAVLRDLALLLAQTQGFTVFNTTAGGQGKTPDGQVVTYPAGAITGYPSLNGTEANKETILARWGTVWGVFKGWKEKDLPRGLYVPNHDIRPESHALYAPLKDPLGVIRDTTDGKGVMALPDRDVAENDGRCFADELLIEATRKWPKKPAAATPPAGSPPAGARRAS